MKEGHDEAKPVKAVIDMMVLGSNEKKESIKICNGVAATASFFLPWTELNRGEQMVRYYRF